MAVKKKTVKRKRVRKIVVKRIIFEKHSRAPSTKHKHSKVAKLKKLAKKRNKK
jgi:hypothetical protein